MTALTLFKDRQEAGKKLARILEDFKNQNAIVLALPRGGVVVGAEIARALNLPLDIVVTRKIGAPKGEEYAIGAIDIDGDGVWSEEEIKNINKEWLSKEIEKEKQEAKRRMGLYRQGRTPINVKDKIVILVDDGIATGLTMKAAIRYVKKGRASMDGARHDSAESGAQKIVIASPVVAKEVVDDLKKEADEVRALDQPEFFWAIGQFYENFPQVEDEEVIEIIKRE